MIYWKNSYRWQRGVADIKQYGEIKNHLKYVDELGVFKLNPTEFKLNSNYGELGSILVDKNNKLCGVLSYGHSDFLGMTRITHIRSKLKQLQHSISH